MGTTHCLTLTFTFYKFFHGLTQTTKENFVVILVQHTQVVASYLPFSAVSLMLWIHLGRHLWVLITCYASHSHTMGIAQQCIFLYVFNHVHTGK